MIVKKNPIQLEITFEGRDWVSGKARAVMSFIKKTVMKYRYLPTQKKWQIPNTPAVLNKLRDIATEFNEIEKKMSFDDEEDFDVQEWLEEIFGKEYCSKVKKEITSWEHDPDFQEMRSAVMKYKETQERAGNG